MIKWLVTAQGQQNLCNFFEHDMGDPGRRIYLQFTKTIDYAKSLPLCFRLQA
jgi:hypothetical protein